MSDFLSLFQGGFQQVPGTGPGSFGLVDPAGFTSEAFAGLTGAQNLATQGLGGAAALLGDPTAVLNQFIGQAPALQQLTLGATSDLGRQLQEQANVFAREAAGQAAGEFSGLGALFSSAAQDTAARRAAEAGAAAGAQLGQQQLGLFGQLAGQQQAFNQQAALNRFNTFANLLGQTTGQLGAFGAPTFAQPQVAATSPTFDLSGALGGALSGAATGGLLGGPFGGVLGGLGGGLAGLFGGGF
jgi:hypothetical protein